MSVSGVVRYGVAGVFAGLTAVASTGCIVPVVAVGAGAVVVAQERPPGDAIDDTIIRADIDSAWSKADSKMYHGLSLSVQQGHVLITGTVQKGEQRVEAVRLAWQVEGVKQVDDEVQLGEGGGIGGYAKDSYIATKLRGELTLDSDIRSINYSIEVENAVVYLMGIAQDQDELNRVVNHARNIGLVNRVVSYIRLKGAPAAEQPAPPAAEGM